MRRRAGIVLLLLVTVGYGLRIIGANSSIPYILDTQVVRQSMELGESLATEHRLDLTQNFKYPLTLTYYLMGIFGIFAGGGFITGTFSTLTDLQNFLITNRETIHLIAVYAFNLIAVLLIPALYLASKALKPRHTGYLAACLGTFNLLLVHFGHHPRPHVPLATLAFIAVFLVAYSLYHKKNWILISAAVVSALAVGTLQNGVVIIIPFFLAYLLRPYNPVSKHYLWKELFSRREVLSVLLFVGITLLVHPALINEYGAIILETLSGTSSSYELGGGSHTFGLGMFSVQNIPQFIRNMYGYQPLLTVLLVPSLAYFIYAQRKHIRFLVVVLVFPLINLGVWMLFTGNFPRILAVLVPFMIVGTAYLIEDCILLRIPKLARYGVIAIIIVPLAITSIRLDSVLIQDDTRDVTTNWIVSNIAAGSTLLSEIQLYNLYPTKDAIVRQEKEYPDSIGTVWNWLRNHETDAPRYNIISGHVYLQDGTDINEIVNTYQVEYIVVQTHFSEITSNLWRYAELHGEQVFIDNPALVSDAIAELPEDMFNTAWKQIWQLNAPGPIIAVYRLTD